MGLYGILIKPFVRRRDIESASRIALRYFELIEKIPGGRLISRWIHRNRPEGLQREVFGLDFYNPVGLGAGLDLYGELYNDLNNLGFSFVEIGPMAFEKPLFFQTPVTEQSRFFCTYVKIRDERGTAASESEFRKGINCGMFIDVFCLDEVPDGKWERRRYTRRLNEIAKMQRFSFGKPLGGGVVASVKHAMQRLIYNLFFNSPDAAQLFRIYHENAGRYAGKDCKQVALLDFGFKNNYVWDKSDWDAIVMLNFEDLRLAAPQGYEAFLTTQYGDYMQIPNDKSTHDYFEFDPDVAYLEYFRQNASKQNES